MAVRMDPQRFDELVSDALDLIPPELTAAMDNVVVLVEDRHSEDTDLLGLYEGVPLTKRGPLSYNGVSPDRITIFQGTISRRARDLDALAAQVRVTVLHEVGHYFGMDDARLHELGWA